jgi:hypothetical protein
MCYKYVIYLLKMHTVYDRKTTNSKNSKYFLFSKQKEEKGYTQLRWPHLRLDSTLTTAEVVLL